MTMCGPNRPNRTLHAMRQLPAWLTSDVRPKMKEDSIPVPGRHGSREGAKNARKAGLLRAFASSREPLLDPARDRFSRAQCCRAACAVEIQSRANRRELRAKPNGESGLQAW